MEDVFTYSAHGFTLDLLFNVLFIAGIGLLVWSLSVLKITKRRAYDLEKRYTSLSAVLESGNIYLCLWNPTDNTITLDEKLYQTWNLPPEVPLTPTQFAALFQDAAQGLFENNLMELHKHNAPLELILPLVEEDRYYRIMGQKKDNQNILLWLFDVTVETQERHQNNLKINNLLEERQRLRSILDTIPYPIWYRGSSGRVIYNNSAYNYVLESVTEHAEEREQTLWSHIGLPDDADVSVLPIDQSMRRHCVVEGRRILLEFHEEPINQDRIGYAVDLTSIEMAEKELRRHIQAHREVLETLSVGISIYNAEKRLTFFNHAYRRMFSFDEGFLAAQPSLGEVLENLRARNLMQEAANFPEYKKKIYQNFTSLLSSYQELEHIPDGRTIRTITAPHPMGGMFYIFENVTDALNLERQYNTQIAVQKETLNSLHEGVIVFGRDMRLKLVNQEFINIWNFDEQSCKEGVQLPDMLELGRSNVVLNEGWHSFKERLLSLVSNRKPRSISLRLSDNRIIDCTYLPLSDGDHLFSVVDVTDRQLAESALRERNAALKSTDEIKTRFLQDVSQLLSRPLQKIVGYSEILNRNYQGSLSLGQKRYVKMIHNTSQNLSLVVEDILDISSIDLQSVTLKHTEIDIHNFIKSALDPLMDVLSAFRIALKTSFEKTPALVVFDVTRMRRTMIRVLTQVIHALKPEDVIRISTKLLTQHEVCVRMQFPKRNEVFLKDVQEADAGGGDPKNQDSMPLLSRIVQLNGGTVSVYSRGEFFTLEMKFTISKKGRSKKTSAA